MSCLSGAQLQGDRRYLRLYLVPYVSRWAALGIHTLSLHFCSLRDSVCCLCSLPSRSSGMIQGRRLIRYSQKNLSFFFDYSEAVGIPAFWILLREERLLVLVISKMYELKYFAFVNFSKIVSLMLDVKPLKGKRFAVHVLNLITLVYCCNLL